MRGFAARVLEPGVEGLKQAFGTFSPSQTCSVEKPVGPFAAWSKSVTVQGSPASAVLSPSGVATTSVEPP